ncbi:ABC transporter ATP-binding protein [Youhaiella tibetensis]|uniref:ABC transporter ATP-binding protein n=1 Tax=Paradevosia tibetensis TaxID=1447062 RepID=A0A5B9DJE3_9HYPH|nr:ABC transporter ATP-binding protein [Youhaiella tibetensis]QEE19233.1 ABC transporter ATP-binding protein [Youhaiella tibetensis]GGF35035.1 ABC transporter ATP-binding protein [Youhaiella tibetensis]
MKEQAEQRPVLSVSGLDVSFRTLRGEVKAVSDVSFDLRRGEVLALVGESGSGKSVTTRAVMGIVRGNAMINAKRMELAGNDLLTLGEDAKRKLRGSVISLVFQDALSALNPVLSIGDQLGELYRTHLGVSRKEARERSIELLRSVHIASAERRIDDYPHQFSGGMRQRILIASAIALRPDVLIADEPTTALDVTVQAQILDLLDELREELGMAILLITHDLGVVARSAERVAVMYGGRIVETGGVDAMFAAPAHPYTAALLASAPSIETVERLEPIKGSPPNLIAPPPGCAFNPRCTHAGELCTKIRPELVTSAHGRSHACHYPLVEIAHAG